MNILLLQTCCADILLTRQLLNRITYLNAWEFFEGVAISLDGDLEISEVNEILLPVIPLPKCKIRVRRCNKIDSWSSNNVETALEVYKWACSFGKDVIKIDSDLFIANREFFLRIVTEQTGLSGRCMPFFIESYLNGKQLMFIQGGVIFFGKIAREFILNLDLEDVNNFRRHVWDYVSISDEYNKQEYVDYFTNVDDVVLLGIMPVLKSIELKNIIKIQISPYDIYLNFKTEKFDPRILAMRYKASGALGFHYEGNQWGQRDYMRKCLKWLYENSASLDL